MKAKSVITSLFVLVLAIAVGGGITWLISDRSGDDDEALQHLGIDVETVDSAGTEAGMPAPPVSPPPPVSTGDTVGAQLGAAEPAPVDPVVAAIPAEEWNRRIEVTLTSADLSMRGKSRQLLELAGSDAGGASVDQRLEALDHGLNLLSDEDYREDALALALRSDLPKELSETLLADLHDRDTDLLIDACRQMAKVANHPLGEEAAGILEFFGADADADADADSDAASDGVVETAAPEKP